MAVSFNVTANKDYAQSSSQIVENVYEHLDQLGEYYHVTDMRTGNITVYTFNTRSTNVAKVFILCYSSVRMVAQQYSPSLDSIKAESTLSGSVIAIIVLSILALIVILGAFVMLTVKLSSRFSQKPNENQPLIDNRYNY